MFKATKSIQVFFILLGFLLTTSLAYTIRTYDYTRESAQFGDFVPFTLESAMMYSYARDIAENGCLPDKDKSLIGMSDISINRQMSISLEYFLGFGYKIKNYFFPSQNKLRSSYGDNLDFANWARLQIRIWISLTAGFIFLWLIIIRSSWVFSVFGAFIFAVSPAAIARATGQDLIRENFAIPIIIASFLCYFWYLNKPQKYKLLIFGITVFGALASWDMSQLCFSAWGIFEICRLIITNNCKETDINDNKNFRLLWIVFTIASLVAAFYIPYLKEHFFIVSPLVVIILPLLLILSFFKFTQIRKIIIASIVLIVLFCLWFFVLSKLGYSGNYSHFANLIKAKIYFANIKPFNPELLDFDSRILWTPGLHSATKHIFWTLFHFTFPLFIILLIYSFFFPKPRKNFLKDFNILSLPVYMTFFYFILFIFMVRFHALVIPFLAVSIALLFNNLSKLYRKKGKAVLIIVFGLLIIAETEWFLKLSRKYNGSEQADVKLIEWFNSNPNIFNKKILADFTLSPMLKAYTKSQILLQPKFELGKTRNLVKTYINLLYHGNEKDFMNFCEKYNIDYFVFNKGMAMGGQSVKFMHPWSNRYMAAAFDLEKKSPVFRCYFKPDKLRYFYRLDKASDNRAVNRQYTIFKVITTEDIKKAKGFYYQAELEYENKNYLKARELISKAVKLDPSDAYIRFLYYRLNKNKWPIITLNGLKSNG